MDDMEIIESFVCPKSSADILTNMAKGRKESGEAAFTWTGPYGSGKSSLVVALSALLGKNKPAKSLASQSIDNQDVQAILDAFGVTDVNGWSFVPIVGTKESAEKILRSKLQTLYKLPKSSYSKPLIDLIASISKKEDCGLFIVFDEMGKFLESAIDGTSDIYFFQQLAELAARSNGRIVILGILHQAFAEYGRRLTRDIRDEWSKIQGRFIDLPLNVAGEEVIELIGRAIQTDLKPKIPSVVAQNVAELISKWRPTNQTILSQSLTNCWPLHPVVGALLGPISRRRFGQNQRSVFGFLNSSEPFGFQDFLKNTSNQEDIYSPSLLWDYMQNNLEPSILASPDGHRWSLAVDAINRATAYANNDALVNIVKCVALMDMFQERSGLVPENDLLKACLPETAETIDSLVQQLESWSILIYKRHRNAYSLYEGSDFDIDAAIDEAEEQIPNLDFERIRSAASFQPIVAKKHYHLSGAIRWMDVDLVPSEQATEIAQNYQGYNGSMGLYMVILGNESEAEESLEELCERISKLENQWPIIPSIAKNSYMIRNHAKELQSLEWIQENNPSLGGDTVARREVESRIVTMRERLEDYLTENFTQAQWYIKGSQSNPLTYKNLHEIASENADTLYNRSPRINSELTNRIRPSANSNGALKALIKAMVRNTGEMRLGIEGYPAEGGLFDVLIENTGLYKDNQFLTPSPSNDSHNLFPLWSAADEYFKENEHRPVALPELYNLWRKPPYGIKDGLMPFFAIAYLLTRINNYAVYLEKVYRPSVDSLFIDVLIKSPRDIALRHMQFSDISQKILAGISRTLNAIHASDTTLSETSEPLEIARHLVGRIINLHPWVLRTRKLSKNSIQFRELIKNANDPNKVLFDDLPHLFVEHEQSLNRGDVLPVIKEVELSLTELSGAYESLLNDLRQELLDELQIDQDKENIYSEIRTRSKNVIQMSGDFKLEAFTSRLTTFDGSQEAIEGIAGLAADKPMWNWIDLDVNQAKIGIAELAQKLNNLEIFGHIYNREDNRQSVAFMVGLNGKRKTYSKEFTIKKSEEKNIQKIEIAIRDVLKIQSNKPNLLLAALSNIGAEIVESIEQNNESEVSGE